MDQVKPAETTIAIPDAKVREAVLAAVEARRDKLVRIVSATVQIPSVNPYHPGPGASFEDVIGGESKVNEYMRPLMEEIGLTTDLWEQEPRRANLVGVLKGNGGGRSLIFNGHVDVVPSGPEALWEVAGPWSGAIVDGRIYGRGSCDMKAGNAAAVIALEAVLAAGVRPKGDVFIQHVVGEEMMNTAAGTGAAIERGYRADAAIVTEPTAPPYRLALCPVSGGVVVMKMTITGKAVHTTQRDELIRPGGAGSAVGVHSVDKAILIYQALRELENQWGQTKSHPLFTRPGHFTIHPGPIGGTSVFLVSESSVVEYMIMYAPQDSIEAVKRELEEYIMRAAQLDPWLREHPPVIEWGLYWPPYDVPADALICQTAASAYEQALGEPAKLYGFPAVCDATFLNQAGIPAIALGPGNIRQAHTASEYVEISEVVDAAKIYALAILAWCGY